MAKIIVVGAGVAGLLSACFAAQRGHEVTVLAYGLGALTVAGGIIDVYGYDRQGKLVTDPLAYIKTLDKPHPYALIGADNVEAALRAFQELTVRHGYPYEGDAHHNQFVPTAIGSFKPSCLIPPSIDGAQLLHKKRLIVTGFSLLKDYYPHLIAKNLRAVFGKDKDVDVRTVTLNWPSGKAYRDVSALDIARAMESAASRQLFVKQLREEADADTAFIIPPILGERPEMSASILQDLSDGLKGASVVEVSSIPPSVTGLRLDMMLRQAASELGVTIVDKAMVIGAEVQDGICRKVLTHGFGRIRDYSADFFIMATGGVFGNGLDTSMGRMYEPVFNLEIAVPADQHDWSYQYLFCGKPQPFAAYGVQVNGGLHPIDKAGNELLHNVCFAGRSLAGYDFCFEKSGNGVCVASAWHAAQQI